MPRPTALALTLAVFGAVVAASAVGAQTPVATMPAGSVRAGMVGIGRTVFAGDRIEEFRANVLGVARNIIGPKRDLIIAKLEGGPLATAGVIQGMSGSPVYIDGKLIGAVSYALGSFPKEPIAGITPIREMIDAVDSGGPRATRGDIALSWPPTPSQVYAAIGRLVTRASTPLSADAPGVDWSTMPLGAVAAGLRPIGAAMVLGGFDPAVGDPLAQALSATEGRPGAHQATPSNPVAPFQPGDPIGVSLVRGDLDIGATGTVTAVDGSRVYAFGHPFLALGPAAFAMTRASVLGILPSLDSSLKIATMGPVVGAITQDRTTAIGGTVGPPPDELAVTMTLTSDHGPERHFSLFVVQDPMLTPLFTYAAVLNVISGYERQVGVLSIDMTGTLSFGADGQVSIDDVFSGDAALPAAAAAAATPLNVGMANEFRAVKARTLDLHLRTSERQDADTIERAWLDTTAPRPGANVAVQVLLRHYRGTTETVSVPITIPADAAGPLTVLVSDATTLTTLEHDISPSRPSSFAETLQQLNTSRRNNRLYVRLLSSVTGTVVGGQSLPILPSSVQSVLDNDKSISTTALSRAVVGAWETRRATVVRGSREVPITVVARQ